MYPIVRVFTSVAVGLALLCIHSDLRAEDKDQGEVVGFQDAHGKVLFLHDFKGKTVLLNLWATWCRPCIEEMPSISKLQKEYADQGLLVLALSEDDSVNTASGFYQKQGITNLPSYFDKGHAVYTALAANGLPTTVIISGSGQILRRIEGPVDWQAPMVVTMIQEALKNK